MNDALRELLVGKVLCGDANGAKILFTSIDFVKRDIEKKPVYFLQLTGEARGYLLNGQNPERGAEALPEPVAVTLEQNTEGDAAILMRNLSRALDLPEADEIKGDDPSWIDRFDESSANSVIPLLREKGLYVKGTLKPKWEAALRYGESPFYYNPSYVPVRTAVSSATIANIKAKLLAKANAVDGIE